MHPLRSVVVAITLVALTAPAFAQTDLRAQFATDSLDAAKAIDRGIKASAAGRHKEALAAFQEAVRLDPRCGMAHFQMAIAHADLGEIDEALAALQTVFAPDMRVARNVRAVAATNAGLTCGRLGRLDEAAKWFSRAILEDYDNVYKERAKAYRNLAVTHRQQKKPLAAAVAVALAYEDRAKNCDMAMVRDFFQDVGDAESARILRVDRTPGKRT